MVDVQQCGQESQSFQVVNLANLTILKMEGISERSASQAGDLECTESKAFHEHLVNACWKSTAASKITVQQLV